MSFLAPWFLLGAAAIAGPILFHLIRRSARERTPFSSLMFLRPTPPRVARRRRLEHVALLCLRCLCLLLLAAGFARPFFSRDIAAPAPASADRQLLLLVDTSASLRREGGWSRSLELAGRYFDRAAPGDQLAVMTFDQQPRLLVSFSEWSSWAAGERAALARQRLATVSPGWMGTRLGPALITAADQFEDRSGGETAPRARELVLITDLQEGSRLQGLQGHEWPADVKVTIERVDAGQHSNAGLEILDEPAGQADAGRAVRVRVTNDRDSQREKLRLGWSAESGGGFAGEPVDLYLPPGQTRTVTMPLPPAAAASASLRLTGDEADFDNVSYLAAPEAERVTIVYLGPESADDPAGLRYYLQRAFPSTPRRRIDFASPSPAARLAPESLRQATFAVITTQVAAEETGMLRDWLERGGTALLVLTDARMNSTLAALLDVPETRVSEAGGDYVLLGKIDFAHPVFAPFADPRFSDFTRIHFWKHRRWEIPPAIPARVLAEFDDGTPALAQIRVGPGNVLVLASGWTPAESQLAVSSKFPPLMQRMLDESGAGAPARFQFRTGDAIPAPAMFTAAVTWRKPDGAERTLAPGAPFTGTDLPGVYAAACGGKTRHFAVNLPLEESRTSPLPPDELARLGVPLQAPAAAVSATGRDSGIRLQLAELERRQKLWRWLIIAALAVTLAEILLGGRLVRLVKTTEVAA